MFGWGLPALMTSVWLLVTMVYYEKSSSVCWWGYSLLPFFWILEGPRIIIIVVSSDLTKSSTIYEHQFNFFFITTGQFYNINYRAARAFEEN